MNVGLVGKDAEVALANFMVLSDQLYGRTGKSKQEWLVSELLLQTEIS